MSRAPQLSAHSGRLERWLGKESIEHVTKLMGPWYGRPIPLAGVPGRGLVVCPGGDVRGRVYGGAEACIHEFAADQERRFRRAMRAVADPATLNAGFASLSAFIAAYSDASKRRKIPFTKVGANGTTNATNSLWQSTGHPQAGAAGSAAPGGRALDASTTGAMTIRNAAGGQTMKFAAAYATQTVINNTLLLYDRIFDVAKTMSSAVTEAVTGVPTRYQSTTPGAEDSAEDNFLFPEVQSTLGAGAHNWTVCEYTSQDGTPTRTLPSLAGISSAAAQRLDMPLGHWFAPLASGDTGIKALTQMQCSASITGALNFVIGHPIAWMPLGPATGVMAFIDGVTTAFERIFDDACLAFLEPVRPTSTATTYSGTILGVCS